MVMVIHLAITKFTAKQNLKTPKGDSRGSFLNKNITAKKDYYYYRIQTFQKINGNIITLKVLYSPSYEC